MQEGYQGDAQTSMSLVTVLPFFFSSKKEEMFEGRKPRKTEYPALTSFDLEKVDDYQMLSAGSFSVVNILGREPQRGESRSFSPL
jgi:hypothetical protein